MIGRLTDWARRVLKPLPQNVSSITELVEVWMSPSRPAWDYVSLDGPWRLIRVSQDAEDVYWLELYNSLGEALEAFYLFNQPRPNEDCMLIDDMDQLVVGWHDCHDHDGEYRYGWYGSAFAFEHLARYNSVEAGLWEQLARNEQRDFE